MEPCLYIISSANKFDFWQDNNIELELEEVLVELNYVELFEQRSAENITIDSTFLQEEFGNYFIINSDNIEDCLNDNLKKVALNGTMTKLELLRYIEEETSNIFVTRYEKDENSNVIHRFLDFKQPTHVGRELNTVIDLSFNADNIEYTVDESDTFKAMAPVLSLDSISGESEMTRSDLQTIIGNWKNLSISKGASVPMIIEKITVTASSLAAAKTSLGTSSPTNYWVRPSNPNDNIDSNNANNSKWEFLKATANWAAPFEKRSGELFIRDSIDTDVSYNEIKSRKDLDPQVIVPKVGTLETSETDKYIIYNRCAMKLIEKRYSEINLEVDVKDIEQITTDNSGFNLYDKVRIKIPEYEKAITAQVLAITKNPQLPGETKITFGNANVGTKINQEGTSFTASNTTVKYKKDQSITATLKKSDGTILPSQNCSIYIHRDEKKITTKAYDEYVKVTTDVVTTVKGNTTTIKSYETIDGVKKLVKTVTKTVTANQIKTVTKEPGKQPVTKITKSDGTTVTKNKNDRDVSTTKAGKISKSTTSTRVGGGKSSNPSDAPLLTVTGNAGIKTSAYPYKKSTQKYYTKTWRNWCPFCHRIGSLAVNTKHVAEGELTCVCDADFDIPTGLDKDPRRRAALRDANGNYNTKNNIKTSVGNAKYTAKSTNKDSTSTKTTKETKKIHHKAVTSTIPAFDKVYNKKTNNVGVVSIPINLDKGTYKVTFSYGGSIAYGSCSREITLTVN
ncbi:MAG: hypothetical protein IJH34_01850 [Romboutsia sp.]|nr:hypothetical protein [Romboutsia sp.]